MADTTDLSAFTDEELEAFNQQIGVERAASEASYKGRQKAVADEIERRARAARLAKLTEGLSDEDKDALRQSLGL